MSEFKLIISIVSIFVVIFLLIKKFDTKAVLLGVGIILAILSLNPLECVRSFSNMMSKSNLIKTICACMGFAYVMQATKCDQMLVKALIKPIKKIGFFLIPFSTIITFFATIAIPSASGCAAAIGSTLIPILLKSGISPAMSAACITAGTFGGVISPGYAHNIFISNLTKTPMSDLVVMQLPFAFIALGVVVISLSILSLIYKDYKKVENLEDNDIASEKINYIHAFMPILPLVILIFCATPLIKYAPNLKMDVSEAMIFGAIVAVFITLSNPAKITKEFFSGCGHSYAEIVGIIISASVFVAGLKACGLIEYGIEFLKNKQEFVKFGGTYGPFVMSMITGSGDAGAMAFNTAITPHADALGFSKEGLGLAVAISGPLGRAASLVSGVGIICAKLANTTTLQMCKRTAPAMILAISAVAFML